MPNNKISQTYPEINYPRAAGWILEFLEHQGNSAHGVQPSRMELENISATRWILISPWNKWWDQISSNSQASPVPQLSHNSLPLHLPALADSQTPSQNLLSVREVPCPGCFGAVHSISASSWGSPRCSADPSTMEKPWRVFFKRNSLNPGSGLMSPVGSDGTFISMGISLLYLTSLVTFLCLTEFLN